MPHLSLSCELINKDRINCWADSTNRKSNINSKNRLPDKYIFIVKTSFSRSPFIKFVKILYNLLTSDKPNTPSRASSNGYINY